MLKGKLLAWPAPLDWTYDHLYEPFPQWGRQIISGSRDRTIRIWDAETGVVIGEPIMGHTDAVTSIAYSPDGRHIISGSHDKSIRIWDAETGDAVRGPLEGHTWAVQSGLQTALHMRICTRVKARRSEDTGMPVEARFASEFHRLPCLR